MQWCHENSPLKTPVVMATNRFYSKTAAARLCSVAMEQIPRSTERISSLQNVITDKWHDGDMRQNQKSRIVIKKRLTAVAKKNGKLFSTFSADQLTDDSAYCDVLA